MKKVVCFGDSNTWGFSPFDGNRYEKDVRWTGILGKLLGDEWEIIEEGQCGRTIALDDVWEGGIKNGLKYLPPMLESHSPMDLLIIMLGTNDMKSRFHLKACDIAGSMDTMLRLAKAILNYSGKKTNILLVSPIWVGEKIAESCFNGIFDKNTVQISKELAVLYERTAQGHECLFLDAAKVAEPSKEDCLHMCPKNHRKLAEEIYKKVTEERI